MQLKYHMVTIEDLVPEEHLLRKVDAALDLSFVYEETAPLYIDKELRASALYRGHCSRLLPSFNCFHRHIDLTDKVIVNVHLLDALSAGSVSFMEDYLFHKHTQNLWSKLLRFDIASDHFQKTFNVDLFCTIQFHFLFQLISAGH